MNEERKETDREILAALGIAVGDVSPQPDLPVWSKWAYEPRGAQGERPRERSAAIRLFLESFLD